MNRKSPATALLAVVVLLAVVLLTPASFGAMKKVDARPNIAVPTVAIDDAGVPLGPTGGPVIPEPIPVPNIALHDTMRHLWMDHIVWSRVITMSIFSDLKGTPEYEARLAMNTYDLKNLLTPYFGKADAATFETLFMQHVTLTSVVFEAYKEGNETLIRDVSYDWYQNAEEIAHFLSKINPVWDYEEMRSLWKSHLDTVLNEMLDYKQGDAAGDVMCYDAAQDHVFVLADFLTDGLVAKEANK